jgi:hypothetical protein
MPTTRTLITAIPRAFHLPPAPEVHSSLLLLSTSQHLGTTQMQLHGQLGDAKQNRTAAATLLLWLDCCCG